MLDDSVMFSSEESLSAQGIGICQSTFVKSLKSPKLKTQTTSIKSQISNFQSRFLNLKYQISIQSYSFLNGNSKYRQNKAKPSQTTYTLKIVPTNDNNRNYNPSTPYAISKLAFEMILNSYGSYYNFPYIIWNKTKILEIKEI